MNLMNNGLRFMHNIGYVINLNIRIYYSGVLRRVCHFIPYYSITILFKTYIMNSIFHTSHFVSNIRHIINMNIRIYYSGAPRRSGAPRHVCHIILYYIIIILFKRHITNLVNNELQFMNNIGYVINLNIRIYYGGAPRRSGTPRRICHFIPYYIIIIPFKTYIINSYITIHEQYRVHRQPEYTYLL